MLIIGRPWTDYERPPAPGWVRTDGTNGRGLLDPDESAAGLIARIDALTLSRSGGFWHANGETLPW